MLDTFLPDLLAPLEGKSLADFLDRSEFEQMDKMLQRLLAKVSIMESRTPNCSLKHFKPFSAQKNSKTWLTNGKALGGKNPWKTC